MKLHHKLVAPFVKMLKQPVESFISLETSDDEYTLVAEDGSLVTFFKVDGNRQIIGDEEYNYIIDAATLKLGARFDRQGHALQVFFSRNPARMKKELPKMMKGSRTAAKSVDINMDDVFDEKERHLSNFLIWEEIYFVLWTRPSALTKNDLARAAKQARGRQWVPAADAQNPMTMIEPLKTRHKSYVMGMLSGLDELGMHIVPMEVHDALKAVRSNLYPSLANDEWQACLPGDPIPPRQPESKNDYSEVLWPPLRKQIASKPARVITKSIAKIHDMLWGGVDLELAPMDPSPFPMLLNRLYEGDIPYRLSFLIEGGGIYGAQMRRIIATMLSITNSENKLIKRSLEALEEIAKNEPVVRFRMSMATWAPEGQQDLLEDRISYLMQAMESWGYCQVSQVAGDPLDAVMSSALGLACASTAPPAVAPLREVMKLLPWQRPSSPFETGAMMFRTPDGKAWPYQTGTNLTTTWFDLIFAQPGAGKSVLLNSLNLSTCLSPGLHQLPFVAVVDIGPSSSGLVSMIKEALPPERRHEAAYHRMQLAHQYAVNPFDTQMGCRAPLIDERSYLVEFLSLLSTPPGADKAYDGVQQLAGFVVDEMFRWRSDKEANAEPRPYLPRMDARIDEEIQRNNFHLPTDPYWWDIVDIFYDAGMVDLAMVAQRHAVPTLGDAITAARRPQIRSLLEETKIGSSTESVIHAFERMITSAIREFPIIATVTQFDVSSARVCSLDLMDVAPQGDDLSDRQTSIMYMLARHTLIRNWWMNEDQLEFIPEKYREFHRARLRKISESPKRLCYDEFHRTSKSPAVRTQVIRDVREGRKRGVQIVLTSQLLDDFDDDMVDLATGVWVLGAAVSERSVDRVQERFGLSETAKYIIRHRLTGPKSTGAPALLLLGTTSGKYEQHLINTLGPLELWALSTSMEDVAIRTRLYDQIGASRARRLLAVNFPGGSARDEIRRRVTQRAEEGEVATAATSAVIEEIVAELVEAARQKVTEDVEKD